MTIRWGDATAYDLAGFEATFPGQGQGNLNADPLFVDASGKDFRLQEGSAAVNAGLDHPVYGLFERLYGIDVAVDAEDGTTSGWVVYDDDPQGAQVSSVFDGVRQSQVIQVSGSGTANGYRLRNDGGSPWHNTDQRVIEWSMAYSEDLTVYVDVETTAGQRFLYYTPVDADRLGTQRYVHHGLGSDVIDGLWRTVVRDLQADLEQAQPGQGILEVNGFYIRGSGRVDDVRLRSQ